MSIVTHALEIDPQVVCHGGSFPPDRVHVEVAERTPDGLRWSAHGPGDVVFTPYGVLHLDELYAAIDAVATRQTE